MASNPRLNSVDKIDLRVYRTGPLFDHNFGFDVLHKDLFRPSYLPSFGTAIFVPGDTSIFEPVAYPIFKTIKRDTKVNLDVQQFKPDEIRVKMVGNDIVVEGKHKERQDEHGYISRQFQRRYKLPEDIVLDAVVSKLSSDGVLSIEAPKKTVGPPSNGQVIQITHTNTPAVTSVPGVAMEENSA